MDHLRFCLKLCSSPLHAKRSRPHENASANPNLEHRTPPSIDLPSKSSKERLRTRQSLDRDSIDSGAHANRDRANERLRAEREAANVVNPFIRLPAEVRNKIYLEFMKSIPRDRLETGIIGCTHRAIRLHKEDQAILYICRTIRADTIPILYSNIKHRFFLSAQEHYRDAIAYITALPLAGVASMRTLVISTFTERVYQSGQHRACGDDHVASVTVTINASAEAAHSIDIRPDSCPRCLSDENFRSTLHRIVGEVFESCKRKDLRREDLLKLMKLLQPYP